MQGLMHTLAMYATTFGIAAAATCGMATVCRWLKWSPINITVNVNHGVE